MRLSLSFSLPSPLSKSKQIKLGNGIKNKNCVLPIKSQNENLTKRREGKAEAGDLKVKETAIWCGNGRANSQNFLPVEVRMSRAAS